jgi:hypothetical protein
MTDENKSSLSNNWMTSAATTARPTSSSTLSKSPGKQQRSHPSKSRSTPGDSGNNDNSMATVPESSWNNAASAQAAGASSLLNFVTGAQNSGGTNNNSNASNAVGNGPKQSSNAATGSNNANNNSADSDAWTRGGRQFASSREVYTRSLFRICLKFTTSEDEDEGKPEPATSFWTLYGSQTTIGNGAPSSNAPDDICRRMDDSMTGPSAGILSRLTDFDGDQAAGYALRSGITTGWHIRGDRGDAALRVGKAKVFAGKNGPEGPTREAQMLSMDADRWILCKGASFAAGNSVFNVEDFNEAKQKITVHCSKGPMRGKLIDIIAQRCPFVFGRAHEADLCIMDRELSRRHGAILYIPGRKTGRDKRTAGSFVLVDLESTVRP